jgi:hypothetical protein
VINSCRRIVRNLSASPSIVQSAPSHDSLRARGSRIPARTLDPILPFPVVLSCSLAAASPPPPPLHHTSVALHRASRHPHCRRKRMTAWAGLDGGSSTPPSSIPPPTSAASVFESAHRPHMPMQMHLHVVVAEDDDTNL